ncbi:uncharacterized protein LOC129598465 [Paramacrobiotus metropolitanus]|uniref:uncharacterized protein LOC129598465 n=1 Tax=Paramacrobiotus metropolitanus TaxID=2943436 RepID=UPI002445DABC|nr:uncharacterized protein LOC129598465 [Paramacrobiotus metropolitanus]XP_055352357.1 uncharacterized protein LOC129598465 [Paramacrobiotus metropolitanus]
MLFQLTANFQSGEGVQGVFDIAVTFIRWIGASPGGWGTIETTLLRKSISTSGRGAVTVSVPLKEEIKNPLTYYHNAVTIQANFTEAATGLKRNATPAVITVETGPHRIKFTSDTATFRPGYPYQLKASISDCNGRLPVAAGRTAQIIVTSANVSAGQGQIVSPTGDVACVGQPPPRPYDFEYHPSSSRWSQYGAVFGRQRARFPYDGFGINGGGFQSGAKGDGRKKRSVGPFVEYSKDSCHNLPFTTSAQVAADGTLSVTIPTLRTADAMNILVSYDSQPARNLMVYAKQSASGSFLEISAVSDDLYAGDVAGFTIDTTTRLNETIHIVVMSSSNSSFLWSDSISTPGQRLTVSVPLTDSIGPTGRLIAYYVREDGELVGNILLLQIVADPSSRNVALSVTTKNGSSIAQPGDMILVKAKTAPWSTVVFLAMEERRPLLKPDNDITPAIIEKTGKVSDGRPVYRLSMADYLTKPIDSGPVQHYLLTNTKSSSTKPEIATMVRPYIDSADCSCPMADHGYGFIYNKAHGSPPCRRYCAAYSPYSFEKTDDDGEDAAAFSDISTWSPPHMTQEQLTRSFLYDTALAET